jgi:hypothetical protein
VARAGSASHRALAGSRLDRDRTHWRDFHPCDGARRCLRPPHPSSVVRHDQRSDRTDDRGRWAVVAGRTHATGTYDGVAYTAEIRFTDVFERHAGDWRAVRSHASNIAK